MYTSALKVYDALCGMKNSRGEVEVYMHERQDAWVGKSGYMHAHTAVGRLRASGTASPSMDFPRGEHVLFCFVATLIYLSYYRPKRRPLYVVAAIKVPQKQKNKKKKLAKMGTSIVPPARPTATSSTPGSLAAARTRRSTAEIDVSEGTTEEGSGSSSERRAGTELEDDAKVEMEEKMDVETVGRTKEEEEEEEVEIEIDEQDDGGKKTMKDHAQSVSVLSKKEDVHMQSPSPPPEPAHGSSRSTGGILRGNRGVLNHADAGEIAAEARLPIKGLVHLYVSGDPPNTITTSMQPYHDCQGRSCKYSHVQDAKSVAGFEQSIYTWDPELHSWTAQGTFAAALEASELVEWTVDTTEKGSSGLYSTLPTSTKSNQTVADPGAEQQVCGADKRPRKRLVLANPFWRNAHQSGLILRAYVQALPTYTTCPLFGRSTLLRGCAGTLRSMPWCQEGFYHRKEEPSDSPVYRGVTRLSLFSCETRVPCSRRNFHLGERTRVLLENNSPVSCTASRTPSSRGQPSRPSNGAPVSTKKTTYLMGGASSPRIGQFRCGTGVPPVIRSAGLEKPSASGHQGARCTRVLQ
ncbi:hypothetical protein DFP72DRAFT_861133 [Ephemerocybe angulata]|uniref:Uncharacterized protein n=1 Tax=Ephemerocybe angulata TaxID=980116 RepID=A0A8H6H9G4_9AGAR|nr:hypothetical protein DFP72DRAFT_861133 [Tulosesus angulatus]